MTRMLPRLALALLALALPGCSYSGGDIGDPILRKVSWFSFLDGEDLRRSCAAGAPDRYRLAYNADYQQQVRVYELVGDSLSQLALDEPNLAISLDLADPLGSLKNRQTVVRLGPEQRAALLNSFERSGMFQPPPVGLELPSDRFYWTAAACHRGRFYFNAWLYPERWQEFDRVLIEFDRTGVPFNPPQRQPKLAYNTDDPKLAFNLRVGPDGLFGLPR